MTNTNCPNCDKPDCDVLRVRQAVREYLASTGDDTQSARELGMRHSKAVDTCRANTVNWRARALTAEAALAEVKATADRLAEFFDRQPSDYRLGLRHGAQRAVEAAAEAKP